MDWNSPCTTYPHDFGSASCQFAISIFASRSVTFVMFFPFWIHTNLYLFQWHALSKQMRSTRKGITNISLPLKTTGIGLALFYIFFTLLNTVFFFFTFFIYVYIYIYIYTHTHTYTYTYFITRNTKILFHKAHL